MGGAIGWEGDMLRPDRIIRSWTGWDEVKWNKICWGIIGLGKEKWSGIVVGMVRWNRSLSSHIWDIKGIN
jgi:hypothetical protein